MTASAYDALWERLRAEREKTTALKNDRDTMLTALKRALFVLESPAVLPLADGAGTVDLVRNAIKQAEAA